MFPNALLYLVQLTTTQYTSHNTQSCDNYKAGQCSQVYRINKDIQQFVRCNMTLYKFEFVCFILFCKIPNITAVKKVKNVKGPIIEQEKDRREGKGRCCCTYSI